MTPKMKWWWPWLPITRGDITGISFAIILAIFVIIASIFGPSIAQKINHGFGPEWDCTNLQQPSALSCIKHPTEPPNRQ
jgi:hypothetical protein